MSNETVLTMVGNLTADPELRFLPNGVAMLKFNVASTPRTLDKESGQWKDGETLFMACTAWRELAEHAAESLAKGSRVVVIGRLKLSKWDDKETGEKRSGYGLDVDEIGPSLRFATAKVTRMSRAKGDGFVPTDSPDDAWAAASAQRPVPAGV